MSVAEDRDRLFDLLADRALVGVDGADEADLARLLVDFPDTEMLARDIELAAAAVALVGLQGRLEPLPQHLFGKIEADAHDGMPTTVHRLPDIMAAAQKALREQKQENSAVTEVAPLTQISAATVKAATEPPPAPVVAPTPNAMKQTFQMQGRPFALPPPGSIPQAPPTPSPVSTPAGVNPNPNPNPNPVATAKVAPYQGQGPAQQGQGSSGHQPAYPAMQPPQQQQHQPPQQNVVPIRPIAQPAPAARSGGRGLAITGWLAAAACLLLAAATWYLRPRTQIVTLPTPPPTMTVVPSASVPLPPPSVVAERESLLAKAGTAKIEWTKNAKEAASKQATGDVVWNAAEQRGFMRFKGLAKNDKRSSVYQLWIFDKSRDDKYPVDGGVFEIDDESGDVIVPIKARLPVGEIALFAVTVEKPGGVVVSKREHIVVTAKPAT